jgi:Enoyl-CoA hydratase/isomerase
LTDAVSYQVANGVAWLTIERPEARNALNAAVRTGLYAGARRFNDDDTAKVLVLTGAGEKAFCAGGDLKEMAADALTVPPPDFVPQFGRNVDVAKPTIAPDRAAGGLAVEPRRRRNPGGTGSGCESYRDTSSRPEQAGRWRLPRSRAMGRVVWHHSHDTLSAMWPSCSSARRISAAVFGRSAW